MLKCPFAYVAMPSVLNSNELASADFPVSGHPLTQTNAKMGNKFSIPVHFCRVSCAEKSVANLPETDRTGQMKHRRNGALSCSTSAS